MLLKNEFIFMKKSKIKAGEGKKDGKYPFFTSSDTKILFLDDYLFDDESVILGTGGMPSCNYYNGKFSVSTDNFVLKSKGCFLAKTLYYFLRNNNFLLLERGFHGAGLKHIGKDYLENIELPSISQEKQQAIIKELDSIVLAIRQAEKNLSQQDELIKSRFNELFMNGNKDKYPLSKWEEVVTIKHGKDYKKNIAKSGGYPVYGSGGFMGVYADNYLVNEEATIIGRKGTIDKPIFINEKFWNVDTAFGIEVDKKVLNPLFFFIRCTLYELKFFSASTTLPSMTKDTLHKIEIGIPPLELQNEFAYFVEQIDKSKFIIQQQIKDLRELLDKKMDEYFGGYL